MRPVVWGVTGGTATSSTSTTSNGTGGTGAPSIPFVGRNSELDLLKQKFQDVDRTRHGSAVLVTGQPGIGKTRLVGEFLGSRIKGANAPLILVGRCNESTTDAYAPLLDAVAPLAAGGNALAMTLQMMLRQARVPGDTPVAGLDTVPEVVRLLLTPKEGRSATILAIEDLHWADSPTVGLISGLISSLPELPLLLIATYRPEFLVGGETPVPFAAARDQMECSEGVSVSLLRPLSPAEVERILRTMANASALPPPFLEQLKQVSGGVPFFVEEILRNLLEAGAIRIRRGRWVAGAGLSSVPLPETVRAVLDSRILRLPPTARHLAEIIACGRDGTRAEVASSVLGEGFSKAAKELLASQILVRPAGRYRFSHHLLKEAVRRETPADRRTEIHRKMAEAIERWEPDPGELAFHYHRSGSPVHAFPPAVVAGDRALDLRESGGAVSYYTIALESAMALDSGPIREQVPSLHHRRGNAFLSLGNAVAAEADFMAGLASGPDRVLEALLQVGLAKVASHRNEYSTSLRIAREALAVLEAQGAWPDAVDCRRVISAALWRTGEFRQSLYVTNIGQQTAEALSDERRVALCLVDGGNVLRDMGEHQEAINRLRRGIVLLEILGKADELALALNNLGAVHKYLGEWEKALVHFTQCVAKSRSVGYPMGIAYGLKNSAHCYAMLGKLAEADKACDQAFKLFQLLERKEGLADVYRFYGLIHRFRREWASAESFFETAIEIARETNIPDLVGDLQYDAGLMHRDHGDVMRARAQFEEALAIYERIGNAVRTELAKAAIASLDVPPAPTP